MVDIGKRNSSSINLGFQMLSQICEEKTGLITFRRLLAAKADGKTLNSVFACIPPLLKGAQGVFTRAPVCIIA